MIEFIHGWGCGRLHPDSFDRGYFGNPFPFTPSKKLVVHSFGLHLVPSFDGVETLIICSSFVTFVSKKRIVERMLKRFETDPYGVLKDFLGKEINGPIDKNLLYTDLKMLSTSVFDVGRIESIPNIFIVHGRNDTVTPFQWGEELHQKIKQSTFCPNDLGHFDSIQEADRLGLF